jgi:hypothetical protein
MTVRLCNRRTNYSSICTRYFYKSYIILTLIKWPPRSPDLTPLDYFLWGHLKTVVYANPPTNLIDLKQKIIAAYNQLTEGQISSATNKEFLRRTEACLNFNGEKFEQFIR